MATTQEEWDALPDIESEWDSLPEEEKPKKWSDHLIEGLSSIGKPIDIFSRSAIASVADTIQRTRKKNADIAKEYPNATGFGIIPPSEEFNKDYYNEQALSEEDQKSTASQAGKIAPEFAALLWNPEGAAIKGATKLPKALEYLKDFLKTGTTQGTIGAAFHPENPLEAGFWTGGLGALGAGIGKAVSSGGPFVKLAERLSLMGLGGWAGHKVGKKIDHPYYGTAIGALLPSYMWREIKPAQNIEKQSIKQFGENIIPFSKEPEVSQLYNKSYYKEQPAQKITKQFKNEQAILVPESRTLSEIKDNEIFKEAQKLIRSKKYAAYRQALKGVPKDSVEYLDSIKKIEGDMLISPDQGRFAKDTIKEAQKELVNELDKISPIYKEARALSERQINKREMFDELYKKGVTGDNFAQFLANPHDYKNFQNSLRNVPDAQNQLKVMKEIFDKIKDIKPSETFGGKANLLTDIIKTYKYDSAMKELASNPVWKGQLNDLLKISDNRKLADSFINMVSKIGTSSMTSSNK